VAKIESFGETNKKIAEKCRKNLKLSDFGQKEVPFRAKRYKVMGGSVRACEPAQGLWNIVR